MSVFETLRELVPLEQIAGARPGKKARCVAPGHEDASPSMHVYGDHVHCFVCGFRGDVVDVWAAAHGLEPGIEAALDLACEYDVKLPEMDSRARSRAQERREKEALYLKQARACHHALSRHPRVQEWWEGRGFGRELRERFLLGANKDGTEAVIPYWHRGRIWGLVRRRLEGEPKYIYPKQEDFPGGYRPLFVPGTLRAGALVVEGIVDALAGAALGECCVAVGGTKLSREQTEELERFPGLLYLLPDADQNGAEAARRWVRDLYPRAYLCSPEYGDDLKDLADLFKARGEAAREGLKDLKARAVDALDLALSEAPEDSARARYHHAKENVLPLLCRLEDEGELEAAIQDAASSLKVKVGQLRSALTAMDAAGASNDADRASGEEEAGPLLPEAEILVSVPGVLGRYVEDVARIRGVVKDREPLRLQTLVAVGAQLAPLPGGKPSGANLILTAEAGRGKNFVCDAVASALPEGFFLAFESASAKSLYYKAENAPEILKHRWIYPNEAEATDALVEVFRPLLSGGRASHLTVNKTAEGRNAAQELNVEGPASITIPTVRNKLDTQLQTRMLVAELPDYEGRVAEHSRALSRQLLPEQASEDHAPRIRAWQAAFRSLAAIRRVVFPLDRDEFCFDSDTVSYGARLWANLIGLMLAHAWLEQRNREIIQLPSGERAIVATPEDYEAAYRVFEATCERSVVNLSDTHRAILDAVYELKQHSDLTGGFSLRKIAEKAGIHHSTVAEHKTYLTRSAKLLREIEGGGLDVVADAEPSWWQKDNLLLGFPRPERVRGWWEEDHGFAPESSRQTRHPEDGAEDPRTHAESHVGQINRHQADATRQHSKPERASGEQTAVSDGVPDNEKPIDKPNSNGHGSVSGVSGGFGEGGQETFEEWGVV